MEYVDPSERTVQALVLTPTRELAVQIADSIRTYGRYLKLRSALVFGGVGQGVDGLGDGRRQPDLPGQRGNVRHRRIDDRSVVGISNPVAKCSLRIVRGIMLKGNVLHELLPHIWPILAFMLAAAIPYKRIGAILGTLHVAMMSLTVVVTANHFIVEWWDIHRPPVIGY